MAYTRFRIARADVENLEKMSLTFDVLDKDNAVVSTLVLPVDEKFHFNIGGSLDVDSLAKLKESFISIQGSEASISEARNEARLLRESTAEQVRTNKLALLADRKTFLENLLVPFGGIGRIVDKPEDGAVTFVDTQEEIDTNTLPAEPEDVDTSVPFDGTYHVTFKIIKSKSINNGVLSLFLFITDSQGNILLDQTWSTLDKLTGSDHYISCGQIMDLISSTVSADMSARTTADSVALQVQEDEVSRAEFWSQLLVAKNTPETFVGKGKLIVDAVNDTQTFEDLSPLSIDGIIDPLDPVE